MKTFLFLVTVITVLPVFASENFCEILNPRMIDEAHESCKDSQYGITFEGRKISKNCYPTFEEAVKVMKANKSCKLNAQLGSCRILHAGNMDLSQTVCPKGAYGVTFKGHLKSRTSCYLTLEQALQEMHLSASCKQTTTHGDFAVLPPQTYDKSLQACPKYNFGVTYKGVLINHTCYDSLEKALSSMKVLVDKFEE